MEFSYQHYAASYGCFEIEAGHNHHHQVTTKQPNQFVCYESQFNQKSLQSDYESYQHIPIASLSPVNSYYYPSSAEQSPNESESSGDSPFGQIDNLDSILDEIANAENIDDILLANNEDDLYKLLETSELSDCSSSFTDFDDNQSVITLNSPKRKLSIDSCSLDYDSQETSSSSSITNNQSSTGQVKKRRNRRCKHTKEERALRKKDQNKRAATKYREKKKVQTETIEQIIEQLELRRDELSTQFSKIETEFNVILPLARAAFQLDPTRGPQLQQLLARLQQSGFINN
ncbi:hypothetical protein BLA29_002442 [Euroglyphus maynei]|uniref:BZIP domain-containing protein n=1 Tax=Euroglyphus maynei TaxID=6958 RepID=A0A1Y3AR69_EURMA|nr:hypothetical protein BLA29_002442 [Euroglyphus maynei]